MERRAERGETRKAGARDFFCVYFIHLLERDVQSLKKFETKRIASRWEPAFNFWLCTSYSDCVKASVYVYAGLRPIWRPAPNIASAYPEQAALHLTVVGKAV